MQKQTVKIRNNRQYTENENRVIDWPLTLAIAGAFCLAVILIWGIASAIGV